MSIEHERALIQAMSAAVHYQEYIDTGESFDLLAAKGAIQSPSLQKWIRKNAVVLPSRRDGKSVLESIE